MPCLFRWHSPLKDSPLIDASGLSRLVVIEPTTNYVIHFTELHWWAREEEGVEKPALTLKQFPAEI